MGVTTPLPCLLTLALVFFLQPCDSLETVVMDGLAEWKAPTLHVEDSLVFKHIQNLYLFHNRRAFDLCMFDQATLVYEGSSKTTFTWQPLRPGHYYFSTRDGSRRSCEEGEKVPVRVITPDLLAPGLPPLPAPSPTAGGDLPAFPSPGWISSSPTSSTLAPEGSPLLPGEGQPSTTAAPSPVSATGGIPFISSSPVVPLPTGETDTATIRPLPTPGDETQVVGLGSSHRIQMMLLVASVMMSSTLGLGWW